MSTPFQLLLDIAKRCQDNQELLPQPLASDQYWRGIGFTLAGENYLVTMSSVNEILHPPKLTKIPRVADWILGVANIRGRLVPVMDLALMLGASSTAAWRDRRILVHEGENYAYGFLVDAMLGMQNFNNDQRIEPSQEPLVLGQFVEFGFEKDGRIWPVCNFQQLMQSAEFLQVAV